MEVRLRRARMWLSSGNLHKTSPNSPVTFLALPFWKEGRVFAEPFSVSLSESGDVSLCFSG